MSHEQEPTRRFLHQIDFRRYAYAMTPHNPDKDSRLLNDAGEVIRAMRSNLCDVDILDRTKDQLEILILSL